MIRNWNRPSLIRLGERLRANYWLVPTLMVLGAACLASLTLAIDEIMREAILRQVRWFYQGSAEGARTLLSTLAGSMITVAGIIFSINIVVLTMASAQFGPRLLHNFIRDLGSQVTLGTFTSAFLYCLLVLRGIRAGEDPGGTFVPYLSVSVGMILGTAGLGVLIYFIHHVAISIQAPIVVANVGIELEASVRKEFPHRLEPGGLRTLMEAVPLPDFATDGIVVNGRQSGYIQAVDFDRLVRLAARHDLILRLTRRPGEFVIEGAELMLAAPAAHLTPRLERQMWDCFHVGRYRTLTQDIEFAVYQLVEVAVRTLSPAINDPFTAMSCIDWLGAGLEEIFQRDVPDSVLCDKKGTARLFWHPVSHTGVADAAFNQIRQYGRTSAAVTIRLLEILARVASHVRTEEEKAAIRRHAEMVFRSSREGLPEENDRKDVERRFADVLQTLEKNTPGLLVPPTDGENQES